MLIPLPTPSFCSYSAAAREMLERGMLPEAIDGAATRFGMRVGPLAMADIVGIDLGIQAIKKRGQYDPRTVISHALIEAGRLGQKTKAGYFDYGDDRRPLPSSLAAEIIRGVARNRGISPEIVRGCRTQRERNQS